MLGRLDITEVNAVNEECFGLYKASIEQGRYNDSERYAKAGRRLLVYYGYELEEIAHEENIQREMAKASLTPLLLAA